MRNDVASERAGPAAPTSFPAPAGVSLTSESPVPALPFMSAQVWTGSEILAFGSDITPGAERMAAVSYEPVTGEWRELPAAPFDQVISGAAAVWVNGRLVVVGVLCDNRATPDDDEPNCVPGELVAAAYRTDTGTWEKLPTPAGANTKGASSGSFGEALGTFGTEAVFRIGGEYWALDAEKASWGRLPARPENSLLCDLDGRLFAVEMESKNPILDAIGPIDEVVQVSELTSDGAGWTERQVLKATLDTPFLVDFVCGANSIAFFTAPLDHIWTYDPAADAWTEGVGVPRDLAEQGRPQVVSRTGQRQALPLSLAFKAWTGKEFVFWDAGLPGGTVYEEGTQATLPGFRGKGLAYDPQSRTWRAAEPGVAGKPPIWIEGTGVYVGSLGDGKVGLVAYTPS